jgi:serine/threonine-protein kinase
MAVPERIGRFRVLEVLGRGAMGIVYRGVDEGLDRQVALKVMAGAVEGDARARFRREGQAAARLQHPNIITVYELGEHEGQPFMALELLVGVDLQAAIEAGLRPDPALTLPIVLQALAGLGHAHERGIVHRDVKPSNVFLPRGRQAKIMDFGVARLAAGTATGGGGITTQGTVVGTPNYMSPEQVRSGELDGRSDLFSAGLILYELVTGEKAYRGDSIVSLLYKIAHEPPNLSLVPPGDRWMPLRRVLDRALQRDPANRYQDAAQMSGELLRAWHALGGRGDGTAPVDLGVKPRPPVPSMELGTDPGDEPRPTIFFGTVNPALAADDAPSPTIALGTGESALPPTVALDEPPSPTIALSGEPATLALSPEPPTLALSAEPPTVALSAEQPTLALGAEAGEYEPEKEPSRNLAYVFGVGTLAVLGATAFFLLRGPLVPPAPGPEPAPIELASAAPVLPPETNPATPAPAVSNTAATPAVKTAPDAPRSTPAAVRASPQSRPTDDRPLPDVPAQRANLERADQLLQGGRYASALAEARGVLAREPGNAEAKDIAEEAEAGLLVESSLKKAKAALVKGDKDTAMQELRKGLSVNPNEARLLTLWREATQ